MSILDREDNNIPIDVSLQVSRRIINSAKMTFNNLLNNYIEGTNIFWNNPRGASPKDIAEKLGTDAAEVFQLHYAVGQFLESIKPGCTAEVNSNIPWNTFVLNEDGTVTISQEENNEEENNEEVQPQ